MLSQSIHIMTLFLCSACLLTDKSDEIVIDADGDGYVWPYDCNDQQPSVHPNALELCNEIDDDCDGAIDDADASLDPTSTTAFYRDADNDGYGDVLIPQYQCFPENGFVSTNTDCDDQNPDINPSAIELCNEIDDDCDALIDNVVGHVNPWYQDADGDGLVLENPFTLDVMVKPVGLTISRIAMISMPQFIPMQSKCAMKMMMIATG